MGRRTPAISIPSSPLRQLMCCWKKRYLVHYEGGVSRSNLTLSDAARAVAALRSTAAVSRPAVPVREAFYGLCADCIGRHLGLGRFDRRSSRGD